MLPSAYPYHFRSHTLNVLGSSMHCIEAGIGEPIVFLHGNPTSSYLWRNVIPHLEAAGHCVAIDCIGMGRSGKPDISYRFVEHIAYIEATIAALNIADLTFVAHDWGVAIALAYARRHPERVKAIAFMEGHIHPIERWSDFDADSQAMFKELRSEERGKELIIEEDFFIETILTGGMQRRLTEAEMDAYRAPYQDKPTRLPLWRWVNEIPIEGHPTDVHTIVAANQAYLATADIPKLLLYAEPGGSDPTSRKSLVPTDVSQLTSSKCGIGDTLSAGRSSRHDR